MGNIQNNLYVCPKCDKKNAIADIDFDLKRGLNCFSCGEFTIIEGWNIKVEPLKRKMFEPNVKL